MKINVDNKRLQDTLRANRDAHQSQYLVAIEKYRERTIEWLNAQLDAVKAGKDPQRSLPLPIPEEHTKDFDRAIRMLEWDINDTITLEEHQFQEYVMNQWGWAQTFASNTSSYLST